MSKNNPPDSTDDAPASHEVGDEKTVSALSLPRDDANDTHEIELYDPPASNGIGLKWKCDRCMRIFADWTLFKGEPCIPWEAR